MASKPRKLSIKHVERSTPENGLERAWPSSPAYPPRYSLRAYNYVSGLSYYVNSVALYAMRKLYDEFVQNRPVDRRDAQTVVAGSVELSSPEMDEIVSHVYTEAEADWLLPSNYKAACCKFVGADPAYSPVVSSSLATQTLKVVAITKAKPSPKPKGTIVVSADDLSSEVAALTTGPNGFEPERLKKFAVANGVWDDKYDNLNNGLRRMNVVNRLRNKISKQNYKVKWVK